MTKIYIIFCHISTFGNVEVWVSKGIAFLPTGCFLDEGMKSYLAYSTLENGILFKALLGSNSGIDNQLGYNCPFFNTIGIQKEEFQQVVDRNMVFYGSRGIVVEKIKSLFSLQAMCQHF